MADTHSFGRYRVTGTLGAGAMGEVYAAVDEVLGREVAIKTLKGSGGATARLADERFRNEARAIAQLSHPGVVQVFDIDLTADPPYLVMERVAGPSLDDRLEASGPMSVEELVPCGIQIARALAAAHAAMIVHRDVKPANILAAGTGVWKLADFGVAHVPDSSLTMTGQFMGSPAYAPPEAVLKGVVEPAADIYGLGATLYEAAAGKWPRLEARGALLAPVPPLVQLAPRLPAHVAAAIDRAVAFEPAERPTASELAEMLAGTRVATPAGVAVSQPGVPTPVRVPTPVPDLAASSPSLPGATSPPGRPATPLPDLAASSPSLPPTPLTLPRPPRAPLAWKPWVVGGGIVALLVAIAVARSGSSSPGGGPRADDLLPTPSPLPGDQPPPGEIMAVPPEGLSANTQAEREWGKMIDQLRRRHFGEARHKLDEWEDHWGATSETTSLKAQLDALPPELLREHRGKHGE